MPAGFKQGDLIDDAYEVIERIGEGGFGNVYRVRQLSMSRDVALKILLQDDEDDDRLAGRFRREVLAVRNLSHPNTVRIFDFSETPEGYLYYTMEYLEGNTLTEHIEQTAGAPPEQVRDILVQVLKSLSEAHSRGIVHRDLKPGNVMLADVHGETNFVKVLDFGIAKAANTGSSDLPQQNLTSAENIVGTLRYMAPEQAKEDPIGPYTDLYTLGLVGLELLTGEKVFAGLSNVQILKEQLKPEAIDIPEPFATSPLGEVLARALAKDVERRFESADAMREKLEALTEQELQAAALEELPITSAPYGEETPSGSNSGSASQPRSPAPQADSSEAVQRTRSGADSTGSEQSPPTTDETEGSGETGVEGAASASAEVEPGAAPREEPVAEGSGSAPPPVPADESGQVAAREADEERIGVPAEQGEELTPDAEPTSMPDGVSENQSEMMAETPTMGKDALPSPEEPDGATEEEVEFEDDFELQPEPSGPFGLTTSQLVGVGAGVGLLGAVGLFVLFTSGGGTASGSPGDEPAVVSSPDAGAAEESVRAVAGTDAAEDRAPGTEDHGKSIRVTAGETEAEVFRDGERLGTTPLEVDVRDRVELELRAEGRTREVVLEKGEDSPRRVAIAPEESDENGDAGVDGADARVVASGGSESSEESDDEATGSHGSSSHGGREPEPREPVRDYEPDPEPERDDDESDDDSDPSQEDEKPAVPVFD